MKEVHIFECIYTSSSLKVPISFRQGFSTKQNLSVINEIWRKSLGNGGRSSALLIDLFKTFDRCIKNHVSVAKSAGHSSDRYILCFVFR